MLRALEGMASAVAILTWGSIIGKVIISRKDIIIDKVLLKS